jgi:pyroglutamyl-peptidase
VGVVLPTAFDAAWPALRQAIAQHGPALVMCLGVAVGRAAISPERVATNWADARIADNHGARPQGQRIAPHGAVGLFSTLPLATMRRAIERADVPVQESLSAGAFVCNHVMYQGLRHARGRWPLGFVHVPALPEQAAPDVPSMALAQQLRGIKVALQAALRTLPRRA